MSALVFSLEFLRGPNQMALDPLFLQSDSPMVHPDVSRVSDVWVLLVLI